MTAMPTIQTPEGFLAECQRRGIKLTAKDGTIKASGKPPANPEKFAAFLKAKKPELLALLEARDSVNAPAVLESVPTVSNETVEIQPSAAEFEQKCIEIPSGSLYPDSRQEVLTWALDTARARLLPEPDAPLLLPSGQYVPAGGAAAWLLDRQALAVRLQAQGQKYPDAHSAFLVVRQDLRALCLWCAAAWQWLHSPELEEGALCLLPHAVEELRGLAAEFEGDLPEIETE